MDLATRRLARQSLLAMLLSAGTWIAGDVATTSAQDLVISGPDEEVATIQVNSTVRRARTPANRDRTNTSAPRMTARQRVDFDVEDASAASEETRSEPRRQSIPSASRIPTTSRLVSASAPAPIESVQVEPVPEEVLSTPSPAVVSEHAQEQDWVFEDGVSYEGGQYAACGCDDYSCDGMSCGYSPCYPLADLLNDPLCLATRVASRMQVRVTSVHFWMNSLNIPTLASTSLTGPGVNANNSLFGGSNLLSDTQAGLRTDLTYWLDNAQERALWLRLYDSGDHELNGNFNSQNAPTLTRPFFNVRLNAADTVIVSNAPIDGRLDIALKSSLEGGDLLMRKRICEDELVRTDFLLGYQSIRYVESLLIETDIGIGSAPAPATEYFESRNQFNGGQIGLQRTAHDGCWYFDGFAKIGLGQMNRSVLIDNFGTEGLFADTTSPNIGLTEQNTFVMTPEFGLSAGYLLTNNLHFVVGYSFLRLPKITRVQDALPPGLRVDDRNPRQEQSPSFRFVESNLNVQMLDLGLQYRY